ncbi:hypothetical protein JMJ35_004024 [Cladonia borealis]|uniref:Mitochondrial intermembrane space import and assembly protein 40 n=1 Tax=Cladonia borealis TaxID=184061 RepID=A0AA39V8U8_9LECA|nr:hypothetical protein JMJ35_004024 [Cladonia borealis]
MIRQAPRHLLRCSRPLRPLQPRHFLSTAPPAQKSRSWKSSAVRWGLAIGVVYYYNTSNLFAEEPPFAIPQPQSPTDETPLPTLESLASSRRQQLQPSPPPPPPLESSPQTTDLSNPSDLEAEASQEGAFNEETGVINWDCPCLGGMAHGPCGEQFREAFSCFVYSKEEPKGMDCIPHFKTMQDCFREHPEIYGGELEEDEEGGEGLEGEGGGGEGVGMGMGKMNATENDDGSTHLEYSSGVALPPSATSAAPTPEHEVQIHERKGNIDTERAKKATEQVRREHGEGLSESEEVVPKAALDATGKNDEGT